MIVPAMIVRAKDMIVIANVVAVDVMAATGMSVVVAMNVMIAVLGIVALAVAVNIALSLQMTHNHARISTGKNVISMSHVVTIKIKKIGINMMRNVRKNVHSL